MSGETTSASLRGQLRLMIRDSGGVFSIAAFFVVMVIVFSLITDTFLTEANLLNILRQITNVIATSFRGPLLERRVVKADSSAGRLPNPD